MKLGMNIESVQRSNRSLALRLMLDYKSISRVALAKKTGLKKATITNIINEFIEMGIIEESGQTRGEFGRKTDTLRLNVPGARIISLRITRKYYEIDMYDLHGNKQTGIKESIDIHGDIQNIYESVKSNLWKMIDEIGLVNILGLCAGVPGPYIQNGRNISLVTGFEQLKKISIREELEKEFSFPIFVEHDAKIAAFAEWKHWCHETKKHEGTLIEILSTGQGVGAGIIIDDKIIKGKLGVAGEIGYMGINFNGPISESGNRGIFEYYSSSESVKRHILDRMKEFKQVTLTENSSADEIYREYEEGNPLAVWAVEQTAWYLGYGIAGLVSILNPDAVIIGSDYPRSAKFINAVKSTVKKLVYEEFYDSLIIEFSQVEGNATLLGGFHLVIDRLFSSNQIFDQIKSIVASNKV